MTTVVDEPGRKVRLDDLSAEPPKGMTREQAEKRFASLGEKLFDLQDAMFGARMHGVLVVLQGRDGAGKDGSIKHVAGCLNPREVSVASFGVPTAEELQHDFLWRVHRHAPRLGEFAIFNRSHYEDVLVVRVHDLAPKKLWQARFGQIRDFEDAISETAAKHAPWIVVPANAKWYRNLVIAESIVDALRDRRKDWLDKLEQMGRAAKAEIDAFRSQRAKR